MDLTNPQSLNRYAYTLNKPTSLIDPSGLYSCNPNSAVYDDQGNLVGYTDCTNSPDSTHTINWVGGAVTVGGGGSGGSSAGGVGGGGGGFITSGFIALLPSGPLPGLDLGGVGSPARQQIYQQCMADFKNSAPGKVVQFGSLLSFKDDFVGTSEEWLLALGVKGSVLKAFFGGANSAAGGISPVTTFTKGLVEEAGIAAVSMATAADAAVRSGCNAEANPELYEYQYKAVF